MKKLIIFISLFTLVIQGFGFIAENDTRFLGIIDNPASVNVLSSIEVSQDIFYNNTDRELYLYREQIILPRFFIFKTGGNFQGRYNHNIISFDDYSLYISTGLWKILNIGVSYHRQVDAGVLFNLKYFSAGGKIYNLDFQNQSLTYDNYYFGISLFLPLADNFAVKINSDYVEDPVHNDIVHSGINEMLTIGSLDFIFRQDIYFDYSYLKYNLGGTILFKGVSVYYETDKDNKEFQNRLGVKFFFAQPKKKEQNNQAIFLFQQNQSDEAVVFEPVFKSRKLIRYWKIDIFNSFGDVIKTIDGLGNYPDRVIWDYRDGFGKQAKKGKYIAVLTIISKSEKFYTSNQLSFKIQ